MDLTTEPAKLRAAAEALEKAAEAIAAQLGQLEQSSTTLTNAWEGEAKLAYASLYKSYSEAAAENARLLGGIAGALSGVAEQYSEADDKGSKALPN